MSPIVALMLAVQAAIVLVSIYTVLTAPGAGAQPRRPFWPSLVIALVIIAGASWNIGESHAGEPGADILMYGSPLLIGMAIMAGLFALRKRRGLD